MGGDGLAYDRARRGKEEGRGWGQGEQDALKWYNPALESISALLARMTERLAALCALLTGAVEAGGDAFADDGPLEF